MRAVVVSRMRRLPALAAAAVVVVAGACSDPAAHVTLVPHGGPCGRPDGIAFVQVTAYTPHGEILQPVQPDQSLAIDVFPADTLQIGVEVFVGGGSVAATGKSAPLDFAGLADGAVIPVLMAPLDGFCAVGDMVEARAQPLVARAGSGVLIVGGIGAAGPLLTAEYYDPDAAAFSAVSVPEALTGDGGGFAGTALAALPDGRVALIGGPRPAFVVFDPELRAFSTDPVLIKPRAFHAAIATGADEVMIAGGCSGASAGQCGAGAIPEIVRYRLTQLREPEVVSSLTVPDDSRIGAGLFDLGIQMDGRRGYLLAGGSGDPGLADRFAMGDPSATAVSGGHVQAVALDGGAVLTAFAGDDAAADGAATVYAPAWPDQPAEALAARPIAKAPDRQGVRLIALEDGRVAGFGGDPAGRVLLYDPVRDAWTAPPIASSDQPGPLAAPSLTRLDDGSVLVLGGAVSPKAWVYRPSLVGPASSSITAVPAEARGGVLTAPDPATVTRVADGSPVWRLTAPADAPLARALIGGPRLATGSVSAVVHVLAGGVALIAQQTGPGQAIVAELAPGEPARIVRLEAGTTHELCRGSSALAAFDPLAPAVLRLEIDDGAARLSIGSRTAPTVACGIGAVERGAWGVAALGAGAQITVDSIELAAGTTAR